MEDLLVRTIQLTGNDLLADALEKIRIGIHRNETHAILRRQTGRTAGAVLEIHLGLDQALGKPAGRFGRIEMRRRRNVESEQAAFQQEIRQIGRYPESPEFSV